MCVADTCAAPRARARNPVETDALPFATKRGRADENVALPSQSTSIMDEVNQSISMNAIIILTFSVL